MEHNENKQSLKQKWIGFLTVIFDPWVLILLAVSVLLSIYYARVTDDPGSNKDVLVVLTTIISLFTGLLGGVIANKWAQLTETKVIEARGKSAIRSLKLILLNVSNFEKRTKDYISNLDKDNREYKLIINTYEEIIEKCNVLEEEILSSIENWTDIIPEVANLKTQIGLISEMKLKQIDLEKDVDRLNIQIENIKEAESKEKEQLIIKLTQKEEELSNTKKKLINKEKEISSTIISDLKYSPIRLGTSYLDDIINDVFNSKTEINITGTGTAKFKE